MKIRPPRNPLAALQTALYPGGDAMGRGAASDTHPLYRRGLTKIKLLSLRLGNMNCPTPHTI